MEPAEGPGGGADLKVGGARGSCENAGFLLFYFTPLTISCFLGEITKKRCVVQSHLTRLTT